MREKVFLFIIFVAFGVLSSRLFTLQVVQGEYWRQLADSNRIRLTKTAALRGIIYDKHGRSLVVNTPEGRKYSYPEALAGVLGYVGQFSPEELEEKRDEKQPEILNFSLSPGAGENVGKSGLEAYYDEVLRGVDGGTLSEVDAQGSLSRELAYRQAQPGGSLYLTIDAGLQEKAFQLLDGKAGSVIAEKPQTGEILALVSSPSFDANIFTLGREKSAEKISQVLSDEAKPMFFRPISGTYPPGSTFKVVTALSGLGEGKIDKDTIVEDTGQITVGTWTFGNWYFSQYGKTEGEVDLVKAIKRSNDIYFYKVGSWVGIDKLSGWAKKLGFGTKSGIDLPGEAAGLVPDKKWKMKTKGESWYLGDDFITAIGQGDLLVTPLQINNMTSAVAAAGNLCLPYIVSQYEAVKKSPQCQKIGLSPSDMDLVVEGMRQACAEGGTGWPLYNFGIGAESTTSADFKKIDVACKTGTAESGEGTNPHAWFTVFAPIQDPEIVLTVMLENGGEGSSVAGPIARDILKYWFEKKN